MVARARSSLRIIHERSITTPKIAPGNVLYGKKIDEELEQKDVFVGDMAELNDDIKYDETVR